MQSFGVQEPRSTLRIAHFNYFKPLDRLTRCWNEYCNPYFEPFVTMPASCRGSCQRVQSMPSMMTLL